MITFPFKTGVLVDLETNTFENEINLLQLLTTITKKQET